jgi:hypothetical protein
MDWNGGQASHTYAVGSSLFAGRKVPRDLADSVASEFESLAVEARQKNNRGGWTAKDARDLKSMARTLRGKSCVTK